MEKFSFHISAEGIALGKLYQVKRANIAPQGYIIPDQEKEREKKRFTEAVENLSVSLQQLAVGNQIFAAHLEILKDPALTESVFSKIEGENKNAELSLQEAQEEICSLFQGIEDDYLKGRTTDIKDVCSRIMREMTGLSDNPFDGLEKGAIVLAEDLFPSDTVQMDLGRVIGLITRYGGPTSHVGIISRSRGIPAALGIGDKYPILSHGDFVIMDALNNELIINPDESLINQYRDKASGYARKRAGVLKESGEPARTRDGKQIHVMANAGSVDEVVQAMEYGADGIGLFRSELLFMQSKDSFPGEDTQFTAYRKAIEACKGKSITIRTLDIGGDKSLPYYPVEKEDNPFLGWRGIRFCLDKKEVFKVQLRALLRASAFGRLKIMFPMVISMEELRAAKGLLEDCKQELDREGIGYDKTMETGVMIETPAAVMLAEELAGEVDFFSIGTNDLVQYTLAVDRTNRRVSHLGNAFHPAVVRSVKMIVEAAAKYQRPVSLCGELAGDTGATQILVGMGIDSLSLSFVTVPEIKQIIRKTDMNRGRELAAKIYQKATIAEVHALLEENKNKIDN